MQMRRDSGTCTCELALCTFHHPYLAGVFAEMIFGIYIGCCCCRSGSNGRGSSCDRAIASVFVESCNGRHVTLPKAIMV